MNASAVGLAAVFAAALAGCAGLRPAAPERARVAGPLLTRAEQTGYRETSSYADVCSFLGALDRASETVHLATFGASREGRALPLAVWGDDTTAAAVRASGKARVLVVANIHAGEVDGKEAALALLRDLAHGAHAAWADSLVVLVAPVFNADGNERLGPDTRPLQNGPALTGERANAAGLDLNRDFAKLASPEARALVRLYRDYDPHVVLDLHTTNGTVHAYGLTYAPPLHPNTDAGIDRLLRERLLPDVTERLRAEDGLLAYHYGNTPGTFGEPVTVPRGWYSFDPRPRFQTNYVGLRNRLGILSESYSYAPFEARVRAQHAFLAAVLGWAARHAAEIRRATEAADAAPPAVGDSLALRATFRPEPAPVEILLGEVDSLRHPITDALVLARRDAVRPETMPAFISFAPTERERVPRGYLVPETMTEVLGLLEAHGIELGPGALVGVWETEVFDIDSLQVASRAFQGRVERTVFGRYLRDCVSPPGGPEVECTGATGVFVSTSQPLGRLVFALLEPRSDDGVVAWAVPGLANALRAGGVYPILRVP